MSRWLLDPGILSELRRCQPEQRAPQFIAGQPLETLCISVVTLAEIRSGIEQLPEHPRRSKLNEWLAHSVRPMFEQRVLPITEDVMLKWWLLVDESRKIGHIFSQPDLTIAAMGLHRGLTGFSRDTAEYLAARAPVFNPWTDSLPDASGYRESHRKSLS